MVHGRMLNIFSHQKLPGAALPTDTESWGRQGVYDPPWWCLANAWWCWELKSLPLWRGITALRLEFTCPNFPVEWGWNCFPRNLLRSKPWFSFLLCFLFFFVVLLPLASGSTSSYTNPLLAVCFWRIQQHNTLTFCIRLKALCSLKACRSQ